MTDLATTLLSNALLVVPLTLLVVLVTRFVRHPGIAWGLWGLVLLKFVTPAVWSLSIDLPESSMAVDTSTIAREDQSVSTALPAGESAAATSSAPRPASAVAPAPRTATPASHAPLKPVDASPATNESIIVPSVVSTTILTEDDRDVRGANETVDASTEHASAAPASSVSTVAVAAVESSATNKESAALGTRISQLASRTPQRAVVWLWGAWFAGSVIALAVALVRIVRFRRLLSQTVPADEQTLSTARALADQLGVQRLPEIRLADGRIPPLLYGGVRRTVILLPRALLTSLDAPSRRTLLAHELAHVARRDHWTRWLELLVRCLYWWHPLAWYAGKRLRDAEEQCCDARVVSLLPGCASAYARTILMTVDYLAGDTRTVPTLATGLQPLRRSVRPLHRRLTMIVEHKPTARMSWLSRLILVALAACILPLSLMGQPQRPQTPAGPAPLTLDFRAFAGDVTPADEGLFSFYVGVDDPARAPQQQSPSEDEGRSEAPAPDARSVPPARIDPFGPADLVENTGGEPSIPPAEEGSTITVQRKSYAIDVALGQAVVRLLEQMQRSGLVDPLLAHFREGTTSFSENEESSTPPGVTVITTPAAHKAIGAFIDGLRELRSRPGPGGPDELQIRRVVYEPEESWSTSRQLAELLGEALKSGHIGYVGTTSDEEGRMVITTTDALHKVLGPFIAFLNEQQTESDAAGELKAGTPAAGTRQPPGSPSDAGSGIVEAEQADPAWGSPTKSSSQGRNPFGPTTTWPQPAAQPLSGTAASRPTRPRVITAPQETEEVQFLARVYGLHPAVIQPLGEFLEEVRDGLPLYSGRLDGREAGSGMRGDAEMMESYESGMPGGAGDPFGYGSMSMMSGVPQRNVAVRILAPAEAHEVLGKFIAALHATLREQAEPNASDDAETVALVRGEYELAPAAAEKFEDLLQTCERHRLATPLMVARNQTRVKVIAERDLQTAIREFIAYLSENWKTTGQPPTGAAQALEQPAGEEPESLQDPASTPSPQVQQLDIKIAELEIERANEALEFAKRLVQKGFKSQADLEAAELEVLKAQRELERLKARPAAEQEAN